MRLCPVCDGQNRSSLHRQAFALDNDCRLPPSYEVVVCLKCGFVFADTSASQTDYDRFYSQQSKYDDIQASSGGGLSVLDRERMEGTAELVDRRLGGTQGASILESGCATGVFLDAAGRRGYIFFFVLETSEIFTLIAAKRTRATTYPGSLHTLPSLNRQFDCVVLSHVLEHVLDVRSALAALPGLLGERGTIYVEVPDAMRYADHLYAPFQDFNLEHINHFSLASLSNAMGRAGFRLVASGTRVLRPSSTTTFPAVYGFFEWSGAAQEPTPDVDLAPAIKRYVALSASSTQAINAFLETAIAPAEKVIIWGAWQLTRKLLVDTMLSQRAVSLIVDSNPVYQGQSIAGIPVVAPAAIPADGPCILIGTLLHQNEIGEQIKRLGLTNRLIYLPAAVT